MTHLIEIEPSTRKLRRVGRLARRRMRIDGSALVNGIHTDGTISVEISGLASPVAGAPEVFEWEADRPVALVIIRSGIDGEDVTFDVGPSEHGIGRSTLPGDGTGIRYVAFCYDAAPSTASVGVAPADSPAPAAAPVAIEPERRRRIAAAAFAPTGRERRSVLDLVLHGAAIRRAAI